MYKRMKLFNCAHFLNIFLDFFLKNHPSLYLEYNVLYIYYLALDNQSSIWVKHHQVSVGNKKKKKLNFLIKQKQLSQSVKHKNIWDNIKYCILYKQYIVWM